ncbi:glycoside hydrolase family 3 protein [Lineolata rhizophorae]|uniref:Probable beta-glucosidase E n=1 Tax=Lineolata rhizophorae TaxID=578093 RepID=A0A6A6P2P1_9PEZI|nr:glycoside hydrolase family 3 protein [Lineolata rhizophorae]
MLCWLALLFLVMVALLLSAGGIWVYKTAPQDGQSPPWYPSPKGGIYEDWADAFKKAAELVTQMTLVEKVNITTGTGWAMNMCVGNTGPVARLGFPSLCLQDGPLGVRFTDHITAFPAGITVGATWNKELMYERGKAMGLEARLKGVNVLLGPSIGPIGRLPAGGRNWEGFGVDPVLQGMAAAETIRGIQEEGVMATAKHYVGNEQEHFRQAFEWGTPNAISSNIGDRALHEIYAWPFADSVRAGVASVMCSYNQVNNSYACGNSKLLNGILKDELGFQGFVQSDWLAQRSGVASALSGLDMTMPGDGLKWANGDSLWGPELTKAVLNGSVPLDRMNDMVTRVVAAWYQLGQDDRSRWPLPPPEGDGGPNFSSWTDEETGLIHPGSDDTITGVVNKFKDVQGTGDNAHKKIARQTAAEGIVLLKNNNDTLPLYRNGSRPGDTSKRESKVRIGVFGEDARANLDGPNACEDRGCNEGTLGSGWGSGAVEFPYLVAPLDAMRDAFDEEVFYLTDYPENDIPKTKVPELLDDQDICFVFANSIAGEGYLAADGVKGDRNDLYLQKGGDDLIKTVADGCGGGNGTTIVVIHAVGPVIMEKWIEHPNIKAVLLANLPGQESGNALVDVLFGDQNPSGHLPYTIAKREEDYGPSSSILYYPNDIVPQQNFSEGLYVDYRHFDKFDIEPRFEFGYGLSYSTFHLSSLMVQRKAPRSLLPEPRPNDTAASPPTFDSALPEPSSALFPESFRKLDKYIYPYIGSVDDARPHGKYPYPAGYDEAAPLSPAGGAPGGNPDLYTVHVKISATVTNKKLVPGQAVVQCYVKFPQDYVDEETGEKIDFPVRVLRGFDKFDISNISDGSHRRLVEFELTRRDLSYWDARRQNWVMPDKGEFEIELGFSSRDIRLSGAI